MKRIETAHYTALRVAIKDRKSSKDREKIDHLKRGMPPRSWMKFSAASFYIEVIRDCMPTRLKLALTQNSAAQ